MNINQLNLRQAIMYKMQGSDSSAVKDTINDAVTTGQEKTLPGLGVLFEVLWKNSDPSKQQEMADEIANHLPKQVGTPV
ncbi:small acid-soluble spore protein SspI [Brevibacillus humidisoli]|uniref:small acid-soluble spore protein SspI n=1 Tax=Brevibacillus humidisoli TaxID=2895522 RepID=UPI001E56BF3F|nr:small acid-soluble spore protein SspI [Brevibacillus humidisoli]UFJ39188.1 small acid-soluble spore protein SspI [Brevibacillus humidisoli]